VRKYVSYALGGYGVSQYLSATRCLWLNRLYAARSGRGRERTPPTSLHICNRCFLVEPPLSLLGPIALFFPTLLEYAALWTFVSRCVPFATLKASGPSHPFAWTGDPNGKRRRNGGFNMTKKRGCVSAVPIFSLPIITLLLVGSLVFPSFNLSRGQAQAAAPITSSGLNTQVSQPLALPSGQTQYDITAGTRAGTNLFHSFGDFGVPNNNIANFLNTPVNGVLPSTSNILGRVTGGNISNIFGTIQTTGFGSANLFLMNPAGFLFGPNATINVGGMVAFTSADYLRLADGALFNAIPNAAADALLSAAPVAAFGFLGSNPGAIRVQGSQFTVTEGTGISLVGGNITIQSGTPEGGTAQPARLSAPNGTIQLASAASPGEFDAATLQPLPNVNNTSFTSFGSVSLAPGSNINVSGEETVSIRGGQFVISVNDAVLSTAGSPGPPEAISLSPGSSMISSNSGADAGADVQLTASNVQMDWASIQSLTTGAGAGGNISITAALDGGPSSSTAGSVQIKGGQIQTASLGPGTVGNIQINSSSLSMTDGALIDTLLVPNPLIPGQPGGGTIAITATDSIFVTGQRPGATNFLPSVPGLPMFTNLPSGIYSENVSANTGSNIVIQTPSLALQPGLIGSHAFGAGAAGDLSFLLGQLTLKDGGEINSYTFGAGASGSVQIRASDSITMSGFLPGTFQVGPLVQRNLGSGVTDGSFGLGRTGTVFVSTPTLTMNDNTNIATATFFGPGGAGDVNVQAARITLTSGASIASQTVSSGPGGMVSVTASEQLSISGHSGQSVNIGSSLTVVNSPTAIVAITFGTGRAGAITVDTPRLTMFDGGLISTATGGDGLAGAITVNAGSMNVSSGASISSSSGLNVGVNGGFLLGKGAAGTVTVNSSGPVTIAGQGSGLFTTTAGSGAGGNINLRGSTIQLSNGAAISATSTGSGNAGNITVNAASQLTISNSSITTEANQSSGGAIKITTTPSGTVQLTDSKISASVLDGTGGGGSVNIDPQFVTLQNSQILAQAVQGPGGNIFITTNLLVQDANSVISASSQFGQNGTITIQSPINPAGGKIIPLSQKPLIATALLSQRCAVLAGGNLSSFTVAGRDSLPAEPGSWLSSPLAALSAGSGQEVRGEGYGREARSGRREAKGMDVTREARGEAETPILSLRQIAPPGFLTQAFAVDWSAGCTS
jgi:filamentous hemagglutinin family protein